MIRIFPYPTLDDEDPEESSLDDKDPDVLRPGKGRSLTYPCQDNWYFLTAGEAVHREAGGESLEPTSPAISSQWYKGSGNRPCYETFILSFVTLIIPLLPNVSAQGKIKISLSSNAAEDASTANGVSGLKYSKGEIKLHRALISSPSNGWKVPHWGRETATCWGGAKV